MKTPKDTYFSGVSMWFLGQKQQHHLGNCQDWEILGTTPGKLKLHGRILQSILSPKCFDVHSHLRSILTCHYCVGIALRRQPDSKHHSWNKHIYVCNLPISCHVVFTCSLLTPSESNQPLCNKQLGNFCPWLLGGRP